MRIFYFTTILFVVLGCSSNSRHDHHKDMGEIPDKISEASGLAASVANPGYLWTLNDGGNPPDVFLIDTLAHITMTCRLQGIKNRDWEDIALGAGPDSTQRYVYVADIGDNNAVHPFKYLYRFREPRIGEGAALTITQVDTLVVVLPDGRRDSETMMIDPVTNDLYLISKREEHVHVYFSGYPFKSDTLKMQKVLTLPFSFIVAGSISWDARQVLLKDYETIYYWKRAGEKTLAKLLAQAPVKIPYEGENQGEAICWNKDATAFYTLSESPVVGARAQLRYYKNEK